MKIPPWVAIVAAFLAAPALATVEQKYDRFKDRTALFLRTDFTAQGSRQSTLVIIGSFKGETRGTDVVPDVLFALSFVHPDWEYLRCHETAMLVDGQPVAVPSLEHDGTVGSGYVIEHLRGESSFDLVRALAAAQKKIEIKVCSDEMTLPLSVASDAKKFLDALGAAAATPTIQATTVAANDDAKLDMPELVKAEAILRCNLDKAKRGVAVTAIAAACGGVFRHGRIESGGEQALDGDSDGRAHGPP